MGFTIPIYFNIISLKENHIWLWIFSIFALFNLRGLTPYSWGWRAYPITTLLVALVFWSRVRLSSLIYPSISWNNRAYCHYLPLSTPIFLWGILPIIEIISQIIRPITLTVRLTANLVAGHILIFLVRQLGRVALPLLIILVNFELIVALVQRVVFVILINSYNLERY